MWKFLTLAKSGIIGPAFFTGDASSLDTLIAQVPKIFELAGNCMDEILGNPIFTFFFAIGLVGVGISVFKRLKKAAGS